ncbi:hypothetical protein [Endozoicomonas lisbonensis]|uniref:Uncharacterized protein n=1 Tax=Endozoicomonas lisbonensis TaxID=3120522 RepID=A0ABV2SEQ5_9GAMM
MIKVTICLSLLIGLLKLQTNNWEKRLSYKIRFLLCGIFTYLSFSILKPLGELILGKEDGLINLWFESPSYILITVIVLFLGYFGLYTSIIAGALYSSLLPKT